LCTLIIGPKLLHAAELQVSDTLFIPTAIIDEQNTIMDTKRWIVGRVDNKGFIYDTVNEHRGLIKDDGTTITIRDRHYALLAEVQSDGAITNPEGSIIGHIFENKITDESGRVLFRLSGPMNMRGLLAYLFFFSDTF
jgi:hypothetical protein